MAYTAEDFNKNIVANNEKETALKAILNELSLKDIPTEELRDYALRLSEVYTSNKDMVLFPYLHNRASVTGFMWLVSTQATDLRPVMRLVGNFEFLLSVFFPLVEPELTSDDGSAERMLLAYRKIQELFDHINLEYIKLDSIYLEPQREISQAKKLHLKAMDETIEAKDKLDKATAKIDTAIESASAALVTIDAAEKRYAEASTLLKRSKISTKKAMDEAGKIKTEVITVLSIFAAVIICFSGSITIIGGAIQSLADVYIYKAVTFLLINILGLFDSIFLLLYIVARIGQKDISFACKKSSCPNKACHIIVEDDDGNTNIVSTCTHPCTIFGKIRRRLPYVFAFNAVLIALVVAVAAVWAYNIGLFTLPWLKPAL